MFSAFKNIISSRPKESVVNAYVSWPTAPVTDSLVRKSLARISTPISFISKEETNRPAGRLLQWCSYDEMDHELAHFQREDVLSSSYAFRTALVKKHHLLRSLQIYSKKNPDSILWDALPESFEIEISFADELDEMWTDELWDLGERLDSGASWWILKPGENNPHMSVKIFQSKADLQSILQTFEDYIPEDDEADISMTTVTSQSQHFVVQEYVMSPLLLDPAESEQKIESGGSEALKPGCKFHLRAYCVANGDIQLYLYNHILVFFSSVSYEALDHSEKEDEQDLFERDLGPHVTNPPSNPIDGNDVRLFHELEGSRILSGAKLEDKLKRSDIDAIIQDIKKILADVFRAVRGNPINFQARSNAFELYAVDFLVSHTLSERSSTGNPFRVKFVGIDAEPTFQFIGSRLTWVLENLFVGIAKICVEPFFSKEPDFAEEPWNLEGVRHNFVKFMDEGK